MADTESINAQQEGGGQRRSRDPASPRNSAMTMRNGSSPAHNSPETTTTTTPTPVPMRQLEFTQAMNDFHNMFPSMDREVIEAVLRANNGIVDATIDQLLTMSIDNNDDNDLPDHILLSVQRDVALESANQSIKKLSNMRPPKPDDSMEESPPSYTEAIKSPQVLTGTHPHHHHRHHHHHRSSPTGQQRGSPRHHPHHSPPTANLLDLETDDLALSNTETKSPLPSWESPNAASLLSSAEFTESAAGTWGRGEGNTHTAQSKRSALRTSGRHHTHFSQSTGTDTAPFPHKPQHHRKVSWDTAPLPMRSKSFGGADSTRGLGHHHKQNSGGGGSPSKLPPYKNWNPPLLGTLPEDFLRLAPQIPQRVPLLTQKSDPGHRRTVSSSLHRSHSNREDPADTLGHRRTQSHHLPHRSMSFAGQSPRSSQPQRIITQDISSDLIQMRMRENERRRRQASVDLDPELAQYLEDERLALILQNSEFLQELRDDEDFMQTLERDRQESVTEASPAVDTPQQPVSPPSLSPVEQEGYGQDHQDTLEAFPFSQQLPKAKSQDDAELLQKLKHMGKASKRQFAALARRFFSRRRKKSPRHLFRETMAPSMTNLLDEEEDEEGNDEVLGSSPSTHGASSGAGRSGFRVDGLPPRNNFDFV